MKIFFEIRKIRFFDLCFAFFMMLVLNDAAYSQVIQCQRNDITKQGWKMSPSGNEFKNGDIIGRSTVLVSYFFHGIETLLWYMREVEMLVTMIMLSSLCRKPLV